METLSVADATRRLYQSTVAIFTLKTLHDILPLDSLDTFYLYLRKLVRLGVLEKLERGLYVLRDRSPDTFLCKRTDGLPHDARS